MAALLEHADEALLPTMYREVGAALGASLTALGYLMMCCTLMQILCYPLAMWARACPGRLWPPCRLCGHAAPRHSWEPSLGAQAAGAKAVGPQAGRPKEQEARIEPRHEWSGGSTTAGNAMRRVRRTQQPGQSLVTGLLWPSGRSGEVVVQRGWGRNEIGKRG